MSHDSPATKKAKTSLGANDTSEFDSETQKALEDIDACQNDIDALNEKASEEILKVEQKYNKLRRPHLEKRGEVISKIPSFWVNVVSLHAVKMAVVFYCSIDGVVHSNELYLGFCCQTNFI
jgi:hypothetical protein